MVLLAGAAVAQAQTLNVTVTSDPTGSGNCLSGGQCSLRQAVVAASSGDTIQLTNGTYSLTQGANIDISKSLTLQGTGVGTTTIDGSQNRSQAQFQPYVRILRVDGTSTAVTIQDLTFTKGFDEADENFQNCSPCSTFNANGGGDLFNSGGTVTVNRVAFTNNFSSGTPLGGAVSNGSGTLNMTDVSFTQDAGGIGGALFTRSGTVTGNGVTFEGDEATGGDGGAAYLSGGAVSLTNTTVVGSPGLDSTGAIANDGATLTLKNDTLSDNGSNIRTLSGTTRVENTILATGSSGGVACDVSGHPDNNGQTTNPITTDLGNNLAQDGTCGLSASESAKDPKLASIADNGGRTRTEALLFGSPAIDAANGADCPAADQRGITRPQASGCDIGAFEAQLMGSPSVTTGGADHLQGSQADLHANVNFAGEAGGLRFNWGTSAVSLPNSTSDVGQGHPSQPTDKSVTLGGLNPGTTYYYQAVATNASGSATGAVQSFVAKGPPLVSNVGVQSVTDTTAKVSVSIDPQDSDTSYVIDYGPDAAYGQHTGSIDIGSTPGAQNLTATVTGLTPGTTYHFDVVASNQLGTGDGGDQTLTTDQQIQGNPGTPVTVTDSGNTFSPCPAQPTIDWGDGSQADQGTVKCTPGQFGSTDYQVSDTHTYSSLGHYHIQISYSDLERTTDEYAQIATPNPPPANTAAPAITGSPQPGKSLTCTNGSWSNNPTGFAYRWNRDGVTIAGATNASYPVAGADVGHLLSCTVTASNATGSSAKTSTETRATDAPAAGTGKPNIETSKKAAFSGSVNPKGLLTTTYFQYGLDARYRAAGAVTYTQSTPPQQVGPDFSNHVISASASGLVPNALYHVRMVATNSAGTTYGSDQTFKTAKDPAPGPPILGKTENVAPIGKVFLLEHGKLVPLTQGTQVPLGTEIDALGGSIVLTAAATSQRGKTYSGTFGGAVFRITQAKSGLEKALTTLSLVEGAFKGAPTYASCKKAAGDGGPVAQAALSRRVLQTLRARDNRGRFSSRGRFSAATVRGTQWDTSDRCDGTLTVVHRGAVSVRDFVRRRSVIVRAGHRYLARSSRH
jgi:hypothetical protein